MKHEVSFCASGRGKAQCAPNPAYPEGIVVDGSVPGSRSCRVELPYPAPECGSLRVTCNDCQLRAFVTVAGRVDDPRAVVLPCHSRSSDALN